MSFLINECYSEDLMWALGEAAKPAGFVPHAKSTVDLLTRLEGEGLVRRSDAAPVWHITDAGRAALSETNGERQ